MSLSDIDKWKKDFAELLTLPDVKFKDGLIIGLTYANADRVLHRNSYLGPSVIIYDTNGRQFLELYHTNGKLNRSTKEGPADVCYYDSGKLRYKQYWVNGKQHRPIEEGPAVIRYSEYGKLLANKEYWVNGEKITKK